MFFCLSVRCLYSVLILEIIGRENISAADSCCIRSNTTGVDMCFRHRFQSIAPSNDWHYLYNRYALFTQKHVSFKEATRSACVACSFCALTCYRRGGLKLLWKQYFPSLKGIKRRFKSCYSSNDCHLPVQ